MILPCCLIASIGRCHGTCICTNACFNASHWPESSNQVYEWLGRLMADAVLVFFWQGNCNAKEGEVHVIDCCICAFRSPPKQHNNARKT